MLTHGDKADRRAYYKSMQLRRGPPEALVVNAHTPALRVIKAPPGGVRAPRRERRWKSLNSFSFRVGA